MPVPKKTSKTQKLTKSGITAEVAAERLQFAKDLFKNNYNPEKGKTISVPKANEQIKAKFGAMMNSQLMNHIRDEQVEAITGQPVKRRSQQTAQRKGQKRSWIKKKVAPEVVTPAIEHAHREPQLPEPRRRALVELRPGESNIDFFERALKEAGVDNTSVTRGDGFVVVTSA